MFGHVWYSRPCMGHVQIYHGNQLSWAVQPTVAGRVSDWINHHVWRGGKIGKSIVGRWAYIKKLAMMNTRGRGGWSLLGCTQRGDVARNREKGVSVGKE